MYRIERHQVLPISLNEAWDFFSSPKNLSKITPENLGFTVLGQVSEQMYPGMFINYRVSPIAGIPLKWTTEITHVKEGAYFVDEQRVGPYKIWHHEHFFKEVDGGVEMRYVVHYELPFGWLGRIAHPWLVRPRLEEIFSFRMKVTEALFGAVTLT